MNAQMHELHLLQALYMVCVLWVVKEVVAPEHRDWLASLSGSLPAVQTEHPLEPPRMSSK